MCKQKQSLFIIKLAFNLWLMKTEMAVQMHVYEQNQIFLIIYADGTKAVLILNGHRETIHANPIADISNIYPACNKLFAAIVIIATILLCDQFIWILNSLIINSGFVILITMFHNTIVV